MNDARTAALHFASVVVSIVPFGSGHINETFLVGTDRDEFVLQCMNSDVFADRNAVMANVALLHRHLGGAYLAEPILTRDGEWLARVDDSDWRAWQRVPDAHPCARPILSAIGSAANLLGRFHAALADLDPSSLATTIPHFHDLARRLEALDAAIERDALGRAPTVAAEIGTALEMTRLAHIAVDLTTRAPLRVVHNDAKLDNVLFRDDEAVCLVDLDTVMPGTWFWDIGDLIRSAATTAAEDERDLAAVAVERDRYDAIIDGYRAGAGDALTPVEIEAIEHAGAIVTYEQAVRFLTDWLEGDVYYRIERPDQNLDRTRAQFRLLATMPGTVARS